jgi:hypothetical protein
VLYPQYSISTTGSSIRLLEQILDEDNQACILLIISHACILLHTQLKIQILDSTTRP